MNPSITERIKSILVSVKPEIKQSDDSIYLVYTDNINTMTVMCEKDGAIMFGIVDSNPMLATLKMGELISIPDDAKTISHDQLPEWFLENTHADVLQTLTK